MWLYNSWETVLFLQDLPDVQELIAEVSAEKYSLQAAAILGELRVFSQGRCSVWLLSALCVTLTFVFRHWWDHRGAFSVAGERQHGKMELSQKTSFNCVLSTGFFSVHSCCFNLFQPLCNRLDTFCLDPTLVGKKPSLVLFPPEFQPIPCKPLFFDLALNHVAFPPLDDKVEQKGKGGLTGYIKGIFGFGS